MVPIPPFDRGVLPPFLDAPASPYRRSPYDATIAEFVRRFATSRSRREILLGYLDYRAALQGIGMIDGYQWLNGSFVEDVENLRGRPPNDLDLVTFYRRAAGSPSDGSWERECQRKAPHLFSPPATKALFKCDGYFVSLSATDPEGLVELTTYWYGLFSHRRDLGLWKGMVRVPLLDNELEARKLIEERTSS